LAAFAADVASFGFPSAVLKISSSTWKRPSEVEVVKAPDYRGDVVKKLGGPSGDRVRQELLAWQFVGQSEFGDIYVVAFAKKGGGKEVVPIVFDGKSPAVVERGDMRVEISLPPK
jgi:hypothetical protein